MRPVSAEVTQASLIEQMTKKQRAFCLEYLIDFNGSAAARRAGFAKKSAHTQATDLLRHPVVSRYLSHAISVKQQKLDTDSNALLAELARLSTVDLGRAYAPDGSFLPLHDMPADVRRCICGIEVEEEYETRYENGSGLAADELEPVLVRTVIRKVKFWDKNKAADTLAKCMKLFSNAANVTVQVSLETLVMGSIPGSAVPTAAAQQLATPHTPVTIEHAPQQQPTASAQPDGQGAGLVESSAEQP